MTPVRVEALVQFALARGSLGRFVNLRLLGSGGFGIVLRADDTWLRRPVALKVPRDQNSSHDDLLHEARVLAALSHPNILSVFSAECEACTPSDDLWFFVTEFAAGGSLAERLCASTLSPDSTSSALRQVAAGLAAAHSVGILHRDIKPENVLLDSSESLEKQRIRLGDFGIGTHISAAEHPTVIGTPHFMAPECWLGVSSPSTDVYAAGVMGYLMLTGRFPIDGDTTHELALRHQTRIPTPIRELRPDCPAGLAHLFEQLLAKDPKARPDDGSRLFSLLNELISGNRPSKSSPQLPASNNCTMPRLVVFAGNVLRATVDVIAYSANNRLDLSGTLAKKIALAAGEQFRDDVGAIQLQHPYGVPIGTVIATPGYRLARRGVRHVLHAATLYWNPLTQSYHRQSHRAYLRDIANAIEATCRAAAGLSDVKRVGLTLYGTRVRRRLFPDLRIDSLVAANVQGVHRFHLSLASGAESSAATNRLTIVLAADSAQGRSQKSQLHLVLQKQLRLLHPVMGDILDCNAEALVVSANNWLVAGSSTTRKIYNRGGKQVREALSNAQPEGKPLVRGAIVTIPGCKLRDSLGNRRYLIHTVTTCYQERTTTGVEKRIPASPSDVYQSTTNAIIEALRLNARSVGMTIMCAREGYHTLEQSQARVQMALASARAVNDLRTEMVGRIDRVFFCLPSEDDYCLIAPLIALDFGA
ncbi:MAG: protein kinase [Pirellulaceae bacterium]